jgi:putative ABC transport system permease protein
VIFNFAVKNLMRSLKFYLPFFILLTFFAFIFCTLLALSSGSSQIYKKSGSKELLAVFESNRACVMASLVPEAYKDKIEKLPHIEDITGEVRHMIVYAPKKSLTIAGIEPEKFRSFKNIDISESEYTAFMQDPEGVIIGKKVQRLFNWKTGEDVSLQRMKFKVRGVFKLPMSVYNGMIIFHKEYMQKLVKKEGYFTAITIKIDSPQNKLEVSESVEKLLADHPAGISCKEETEFWGMTERQMGDFGKNMRVLTGLCALLLFVLILNAAAYRHKNRAHNTKILTMAGLSDSRLFTILLLEPLLVVLLAGVCGSLLSFFIWIRQPTIGGEQAIIPPIAVTPQIVILSAIIILIFGLVSNSITAFAASHRKGGRWA